MVEAVFNDYNNICDGRIKRQLAIIVLGSEPLQKQMKERAAPRQMHGVS